MNKPHYTAAQLRRYREQAKDDIARLEGTGKWSCPSNPCYGDAVYAASLMGRYGVNSIEQLKAWVRSPRKRKARR